MHQLVGVVNERRHAEFQLHHMPNEIHRIKRMKHTKEIDEPILIVISCYV